MKIFIYMVISASFNYFYEFLKKTFLFLNKKCDTNPENQSLTNVSRSSFVFLTTYWYYGKEFIKTFLNDVHMCYIWSYI